MKLLDFIYFFFFYFCYFQLHHTYRRSFNITLEQFLTLLEVYVSNLSRFIPCGFTGPLFSEKKKNYFFSIFKKLIHVFFYWLCRTPEIDHRTARVPSKFGPRLRTTALEFFPSYFFFFFFFFFFLRGGGGGGGGSITRRGLESSAGRKKYIVVETQVREIILFPFLFISLFRYHKVIFLPEQI